MQHFVPTISKEQYECLAKFADKKEPDFYIDKEQNSYSDLLSSFLKEHTNANSTNNHANFYKLADKVA